MEFLTARHEFQCAVLRAGSSKDLEFYFEAKRVSYSDDNPDVPLDYRKQVLDSMKKEGVEYFRDMFDDRNNSSFIIFDGSEKIIGSADLIHLENKNLAYACSTHIHSGYRGRRLADLLYKAQELYIVNETSFKKIHLHTDFDNIASQKSAKRNGFIHVDTQNDSKQFLFEKTL